MARKTDIRLRRSNVANAIPGAANLSDGELAMNTMDGALYFKKSDGTIITAHDNTIMHVDSGNDRIGIGTTSPSYTLDVDGTIQMDSTGLRIDTKRIFENGDYLRLLPDSSTAVDIGLNEVKIGTGAAASDLIVYGDVGIGTTTPSQKLEVDGAVLIKDSNTEGTLYLTNTSVGIKRSNAVDTANSRDIEIFTDGGGANVVFSTNGAGSAEMVVTDSGEVGIGQTSPSGKLHVESANNYNGTNFESNPHLVIDNGTPTNHTAVLMFESSGTDASNKRSGITGGNYYSNKHGLGFFGDLASKDRSATPDMFVNSSGNVGIGTDSPTSALDVTGTVTTDGLTIDSTTTIAATINTNVNGSQIRLNDGTSSTQPWDIGIKNDGSNDFIIYNLGAENLEFYNANKLRQKISLNGDISFYDDDGTTQGLFWDASAGFLGIGTTSPTSDIDINPSGFNNRTILNVKSYQGSTNPIVNISNANDSPAWINIQGGVNSDWPSGIRIKEKDNTNTLAAFMFLGGSGRTRGGSPTLGDDDGLNIISDAFGTETAGPIMFWVGDNERARIDSSGNVGIGTDSPVAKLDVAGDGTGPTVYDYQYASSDGIRVYGNEAAIDVVGNDDGNHASSILIRNSNDGFGLLNTASGDSLEFRSFTATADNFNIHSTGTNVSNLTTILKLAKTGAITFNEAFTFPTSIGTSGQVLKVPSTGSTLVWADDTGGSGSADSLTDLDGDTKIQVEESADEDVIRFDVAGSEIATMTDDGVILNDGYNFEGDVIGAIKFKAQAGEALTKGDVVYISGISGNTTVVSKADANDSAKMPAFGLAASTVSLNAAVEIVTFGTLQGIDTSTPNYSEGDELYVSTTAGELTDVPPTGSSSLLQKIAKVTRVDASAGSVKVSGAGRTNATPNLDEGRLFVGNSSNQSVQGDDTLYVDMANSRVGINTTSPNCALHVNGQQIRIVDGGPILTLQDSTDDDDHTIRFQDNGGTTRFSITSAGDNFNFITNGTRGITFQPNDSEAARFDSSGNLLVGKTSGSLLANDGIELRSGGEIYATKDSSSVLFLNRKTSDGTIIDLRKDNTTVGSIGTSAGDLIVGTGNTGLLFYDADPQIIPRNTTGANVDATVDLGSSGSRFKDLYLSGEVEATALDINGNGDISGNLTLGGYLAGPATFTIDPAAVGDNTGTVVIAGNLQVDGTTTTINSTTLTVDDKNITLNYGSGDTSGSADGAGITIQDAVDASTDATILWDGTTDRFDFSHNLELVGDGSHIYFGNNNIFIGEFSNTNKLELRGGGNTTAHTVYIDNTGQLGLGTSAPSQKLDVRDGTITSRDSTNTNYAELDRFVGLTLKGNGAGDRHVKTPNADNLVLGTNDLDRVTILGSGEVGINTTPNTGRNLHVSGKTYLQSRASHSSDPALYIVDNADDVADQNYNSIHLDYNLSGSDTLATTDRTHRGMFLDIDSSASGGDTTNEHRIYGIDVDIDFNGDSDLAVGGRFHVENNNSDGTDVTNIYGVQAFGINDTSGTARGTNTYGGSFTAQLNHSSTQTSDVNLFGTRSRAYLSTTAEGAGINDITGSYNEIEIDDPGQSASVDQAYVGRFIFNNDDTNNNNVSINDTYLVHGTYAGGAPATGDSYGIYMTSNVPKNYFGSNVGIGTTTPDALLEVESFSNDGTDAPVVKITNAGTALADGAVVGTLQFVNKDSSGAGPHIGHIQGIANSSEERAVELAFATGFNGTTSERLRIDKDGNIGISTTAPKAKLQVEEYGIDTTETSTSSTSQVAIHTFAATDFRSARFTIQVTNSTDSTYHTSEILLVHDGTTAYITEFGEIHTGVAEEATFDADISSGNVRLLATPASTDSMEFKIVCHSVTV